MFDLKKKYQDLACETDETDENSKTKMIKVLVFVCFAGRILLSKIKPKTELNLARVKRGGRSAESRQRRCRRAESVIRDGIISAIKKIERFGEQLQIQLFRQLKTARQTQIERREIETFAGISSQPERSVVVVCIAV